MARILKGRTIKRATEVDGRLILETDSGTFEVKAEDEKTVQVRQLNPEYDRLNSDISRVKAEMEKFEEELSSTPRYMNQN